MPLHRLWLARMPTYLPEKSLATKASPSRAPRPRAVARRARSAGRRAPSVSSRTPQACTAHIPLTRRRRRRRRPTGKQQSLRRYVNSLPIPSLSPHLPHLVSPPRRTRTAPLTHQPSPPPAPHATAPPPAPGSPPCSRARSRGGCRRSRSPPRRARRGPSCGASCRTRARGTGSRCARAAPTSTRPACAAWGGTCLRVGWG